MEPLVFYWVFTLIVLIILTLITDIGTAAIITTFIMVVKFISQPPHINNCSKKSQSFESNNIILNRDSPDKGKTGVSAENTRQESPPALSPAIMRNNERMLDGILHPEEFSADDKIFDASVNSGYKNKKALEIRSHMNNNNWKKYYDYEFEIHEDRDWWDDDDFETVMVRIKRI